MTVDSLRRLARASAATGGGGSHDASRMLDRMGDGSGGMIAGGADRPRLAWRLARACTLTLVVAAGFLGLAATAQAVPDTLVLTPDSGDNPIGTSHALTATVTELGAPVADVVVFFVEQPGSVNSSTCAETGGNRF